MQKSGSGLIKLKPALRSRPMILDIEETDIEQLTADDQSCKSLKLVEFFFRADSFAPHDKFLAACEVSLRAFHMETFPAIGMNFVIRRDEDLPGMDLPVVGYPSSTRTCPL